VKDLVIAADQVVYNLQAANPASTDLPKETNRPETTPSDVYNFFSANAAPAKVGVVGSRQSSNSEEN